MAVTLVEEIMLLSPDDESGSVKQRQAAGRAVSGGIRLELVMAGRVSSLRTNTWNRQTQRDRGPVARQRDSTDRGERGLVLEEKHKALGVFPIRRYPESDGATEAELRARLRAVVLRGDELDTRTAGLIALIHSARLHHLALPDSPRKQVVPRMAEVAAGQWAAESVCAAVLATCRRRWSQPPW